MIAALEAGNPSAAAFFRFQAFTTAAVQDSRVRAFMKESLAANLDRGEGAREFKKVVDNSFDLAGLTRLAPHQINNIYETNASLAFAGGQMQKMIETADDFPFWKFSATLDSKTRPSHAALHGKIFRVGDYTFFPPLSFRCRCTAIPMTARQAGRYLKTDMPTGENKKNLYNLIENKAFAGNKQQKFMEWAAKEYKEADEPTRRLIDKAFGTMKEEIRTLDYQSAKEFFQDEYVRKAEREFNANTRIQELIRESKISKADAFRIYAYTDIENNLSADMAKMFYSSASPEAWTPGKLSTFKNDLMKALQRLPAHEGTVYRNLNNIPGNVARQWTQKGAIIEWDGFSSATRSPDVYADRPVRLIIESKTARDIELFSKFPNEKEALFPAGIRLRVIDINKRAGNTTIRMEEI